MTEQVWEAADQYLDGLFAPADEALEHAVRAAREAGLPPISVSPGQGKLLQVLALSIGARRILEIGTLGGYSAIWLARALPPDGQLITCEVDPRHAEVARDSLARAGLAGIADVRLGPAQQTLQQLADASGPPFDLIFIDADKDAYPQYLDHALRLSRPGTLIIADNVVRQGRVADPASTDRAVLGVREYLRRAAAEPRLRTAACQTVGAKGYDGFAVTS